MDFSIRMKKIVFKLVIECCYSYSDKMSLFHGFKMPYIGTINDTF